MVFEFNAEDYTEAYDEFMSLARAGNKQFSKVSMKMVPPWDFERSIVS